jgi:hypothetical protein
MENVSAAFSILLITFMPGWDVKNTWLINMIWISDCRANEKYPDFKHKKIHEALWLED